jgi:hypothetical protein
MGHAWPSSHAAMIPPHPTVKQRVSHFVTIELEFGFTHKRNEVEV